MEWLKTLPHLMNFCACHGPPGKVMKPKFRQACHGHGGVSIDRNPTVIGYQLRCLIINSHEQQVNLTIFPGPVSL